MPVVLVGLFAIALLVTLTGVFLSPKSQPRSPQNEPFGTPRGQRIVEASSSIPARAGRAAVRVGGANTDSMGRRAGAARSSASIANPGLGGRVTDRFGSWKIAFPGLILVFLLGLYLFSSLLPHQLLWMPTWFSSTNPAPTPPPTTQPAYTASQHLSRLSQLDPAQYQSMQEYNTWSYSACSAAAMTEVINSYGHQFRVTDILKVESGIGAITPQLGLVSEAGIQHTATQFGFNTAWGHNLNLDQVIAAANNGTPVIVSFPPSTYPGGHILVVRGGDSNYVYLADSSRLNWAQLTHQRFMQLWGGFSAVMTPA